MKYNDFKEKDLLKMIPAEEFNRVQKSGDLEIDSEFVCFEENYIPIANNVPLDFTIVDCGCYVGAQSYYFQNHKAYIGVDAFDLDKEKNRKDYGYQAPDRFFTENTTHYSCTIKDFLKSDEFKELDLDKTYFIASAVPAFESTKELFEKTKHCSVFYPGEKSLIKGINAREIYLERTEIRKEHDKDAPIGIIAMNEKEKEVELQEEYVYTHTCRTGHDELNLDAIEPVANNNLFTKPDKGGMWLSVNNAWENWCLNNEETWIEDKKRYEIKLKENSNILKIESVSDLEKLPKCKNNIKEYDVTQWTLLDFEELSKNYDGVQVMVNNDKTPNKTYENSLYQRLYGWDCDSLLLFNKEAIKEFKEIDPIPKRERGPEPGDNW
jgi:hypothetical protein